MSVNILHPSFVLFIYNAPLACKGSVFGKVGAEKRPNATLRLEFQNLIAYAKPS